MPRKKQTEEVKTSNVQIGEVEPLESVTTTAITEIPVVGETVDEIKQEIPTENIPDEQPKEESVEIAQSTVTTASTFETPEPTVDVEIKIEPVKEVVPETVTVNKKALYRLVQALNRNQVHMYIGTAATRFLGDLFELETLIERNEKWEEVKKWNEENQK